MATEMKDCEQEIYKLLALIQMMRKEAGIRKKTNMKKYEAEKTWNEKAVTSFGLYALNDGFDNALERVENHLKSIVS